MNPRQLPVRWDCDHHSGQVDREGGGTVTRASRERCPSGEGLLTSAAVNEVYGAFWHPLYLRGRRRGHNHEDSRDLVQDFFLMALRYGYVERYNPTKASLATYIHLLFSRFLSKAERREQAAKNGGGRIVVSINENSVDRQVLQSLHDGERSDRACDRLWARKLMARAMRAARRARRRPWAESSHQILPETAPCVHRSAPGQHASLRLSSPAALRTAACRARRRIRMELRKALAHESPAGGSVEEEVGYVLRVIAE